MDLKKGYYIFDGAMGTMMQKRGITPGELQDTWNILHPEVVQEVKKLYLDAGSEIISSNTFCSNRKKLPKGYSVDDVIGTSFRLIREIGAKYAALDLGPCGPLLEPLGSMTFEDCIETYKEQITAGVKAGADLILVETMTDLHELKAAVIAARECSDLPIAACMSFTASGRTFLGVHPVNMAILMKKLGVDAVGINCSLPPSDLILIAKQILSVVDIPVMVQANAGLPRVENGDTVYDVTVEEYLASVREMLDMGVTIVGGCCGTDPSYIAGEKKLIEELRAKNSPEDVEASIAGRKLTEVMLVSSGTRELFVGEDKILAASSDEEPDVIEVNLMSNPDETSELKKAVKSLQEEEEAPLMINTRNAEALEAALRGYNGIPMVYVGPSRAEETPELLRVAGKYAAVPVLTGSCIHCAEYAVEVAGKAGFKKNEIIFDCSKYLKDKFNAAPAKALIEEVKAFGLKTAVRILPGSCDEQTEEEMKSLVDVVLTTAEE